MDAEEIRVLGFGLGRSSDIEQMQVETNKLTSSLLRCNTSMQPLVTPTQAKAAMFYTSKYCSKDPFELSSTLSLFHQAQLSMRKYGSTASDAGTAARNAKCLLQKVLNKIGNIEVSAQQAADAMLGNESFFTTHKFRYVFIWDVLQRIRIARSSERRSNDDANNSEDESKSDDDATSSEHEEIGVSEKQQERIVLDGDGNVTAMTQFHQYMNKGDPLKPLCLYDYVACIKMIRVKKKPGESIAVGMQQNDQGISVQRRGRRSFKRYAFDGGDCFDDSFSQIVSPLPVIPQIVGPPPPSYPGNRPDRTADIQTVRKWTCEAKVFVKFYSYLFLPWDSDLDPRDPTLPHLQVLPWNDETTWDNFCTIFKSWRFHNAEEEDTKLWYKRSTYRIMNNMVSNLRQPGSARTLLMKWRSMAADQKEEKTSFIEEPIERKDTNAIGVLIDSEELDDDMAVLKDILRSKFGVDDNLTLRQKENRRQEEVYINRQLTSLNFIHKMDEINLDQSTVDKSVQVVANDIPETSLRPYLKYTVKECDILRKKIRSNVQDAQADVNGNGIDIDIDQHPSDHSDEKAPIDQTEHVIHDKSNEFKLSDAQMKIVADLKDAIEGSQLLGYLKGFPGAGKTTTAEKMEEVTGLRVLYCGTTGTASAHFNSRTINSLLSLGLSVDNVELSSELTSPMLISKIVQLMDKYDLLLVDEASMLTPVTLARIDLRMRQCFNPDLPFGGKHILLCGDMWQFPPVSRLPKAALYQSAVVVSTNKRIPNDAYRAGANLFTQFRLFVLNDQQRCEADYADFLAPLRNMNLKYPITRYWLSKLKVLSSDDLKTPTDPNIRTSPWRFATVAVTGNVERLSISRFKAKLFGEEKSEPIVTWICKVKSGVHGQRIQYSDLEIDGASLSGKYTILQEFFVRGAPCVLAENFSTMRGLAKGTKGVMESLVWDPKELNGNLPDLSTFPRSEITHVPQPKYIVIRAKGMLLPVRHINAQLDQNNPNIRTTNYRSHPADLLFSVTYHKLQGLNMDALVLSINKHPKPKLRLTLPSLYVGASRVHKLDQLRVLPFWNEDVEYLVTLKSDPMLKLWFQNYTKGGIWISDGLQRYSAELQKRVEQRLALVDDLSFWTGIEAKQFAKDLDIDVGSSNKPAVIEKLKPFYKEGRKYLTANGNLLLLQLRTALISDLRQRGPLGKLHITVLKSFAKRLGFDMAHIMRRKTMEKSLQRLMNFGITDNDIVLQPFDHCNIAESEKSSDVTDCDVQALGNKVQSLAVGGEHLIQSFTVPDQKNASTSDNIVQGTLAVNSHQSSGGFYGVHADDIAQQLCNIFKAYSLHITGTIRLPDGCNYDRIFNVGGGNCYFYAVCQGLKFFGISIDHIELRTKVGRWLQNEDNAHLMTTHLEITPPGLYHHLKRFPAPAGGWRSYLAGMTWQDWGAHVELLGEWVGPMEITPTNHVLEEMGSDIRVNIYDPNSVYILGDEANIRVDGIDKPIIMVMSAGAHYEWLRLRDD